MKMFVLAADSPFEACWAAKSQRPFKPAAECSTGIDTRAMTDDTMWASRSVHVPELMSAKTTPLKKADGLYKLFFREL